MSFVVRREVGRQLGLDLQPWFFIFTATVEPGELGPSRRQTRAEGWGLAEQLSQMCPSGSPGSMPGE